MVLSKENVTEGAKSVDEKMTIDERYKYLRQMQKRYRRAERPEKSRLLDEMEAVTGLPRQHLTRLMKGMLERKARRRQRGARWQRRWGRSRKAWAGCARSGGNRIWGGWRTIWRSTAS
jgi:hypothetical protein